MQKKNLTQCPYCEREFENKRDRYFHLERWGRCAVFARDLAIVAAPTCACGCGQKVGLGKRNNSDYNRFIRGHNKRIMKNTSAGGAYGNTTR